MTTRKRSTKTASPKKSPTTERPESSDTSFVSGTDGGSLLGLFRSGMSLMDSTTVVATGLPRGLLSGFGSPKADDNAEQLADASVGVASTQAAAIHGTLDGIASRGFKVAGRGGSMVDDLLGLLKN